jgi:hypothetical protein
LGPAGHAAILGGDGSRRHSPFVRAARGKRTTRR